MINLIVLISIVALTFLTNYKGSRLLLASIISFYPAAMIYAAIPNKANYLVLGKTGDGLFYSYTLIFVVIFLLVFMAVYRITQHEQLGFGTMRWINAALIGTSVVLLVLALSFHILPDYNILQLTNKDIRIFWNSDYGYLICLIAPLIAIYRMSRAG